jgi:hypothetical protein
MFQTTIVVLIFLAAVFYAGRLAYRAFFVKADCATGCAKCNAVDFNKIEKQLQQKGF